MNDFYIMSPNVTQPYTSLEKEEKTEVRAHRQAAQLHAKQTFESRVPSFDGRALDEQIPGLSALMTLFEASKAYDYTRDAHCWDINYYGDQHLADDAFRPRLGALGEASSTPALQWFEDSSHKDDFGALMLDFRKRFVPANLAASMQRALELIDVRDYIQTPATRTFMFGDFDLDFGRCFVAGAALGSSQVDLGVHPDVRVDDVHEDLVRVERVGGRRRRLCAVGPCVDPS